MLRGRIINWKLGWGRMEKSISSIAVCPNCKGEGGYHHKGCQVLNAYIQKKNQCKCGHSQNAHGGTFPSSNSGKGNCCMCSCEDYVR